MPSKMTLNQIFSNFPILQNNDIRLRLVQEYDVSAIEKFIKDPLIITEFFLDRNVQIEELLYSAYWFEEKKSILWAVEDINSLNIVGVIELFIDDINLPATVQGFIGDEYRKLGYATQSLSLVIFYLKQIGIIGLEANTSITNVACLNSLYRVGFIPKHNELLESSNRIAYKNNFIPKRVYTFKNNYLKKIYIFCLMCLNGSEISIKKIDSDNNPTLHFFNVKLIILTDSLIRMLPRVYTIEFWTNGIIIKKNLLDDSITCSIENPHNYHIAYNFCITKCWK